MILRFLLIEIFLQQIFNFNYLIRTELLRLIHQELPVLIGNLKVMMN